LFSSPCSLNGFRFGTASSQPIEKETSLGHLFIQPGVSKESSASVWGATVANFGVAAAKLFAAAAGGSSAMLSESIHSAVDGINDLFLVYGQTRGSRPADERHPFGHGKELYFWALIVSCSVFAVGGAVSVIEGIRRILHPDRLQHNGWAYAALACGAALDLASLVYSASQFRRENPGKRFRRAVRESKNPSSFMVLFEESAGIFGELIAAAGVFANAHGVLVGDGIASVLIGVLLGAVGIFLIGENRDLIVGEGVDDDIARCIRELSVGEGRFKDVLAAHTMHFGPHTVLVTIDAVFDPEMKANELMQAVDRVQTAIRERYPVVKYVYIDPEDGQKRKAGNRWNENGSKRAA
jgi:cation diffusion facilitator family transporter